MKFIAVQRVRSAVDAEQGINGYLYEQPKPIKTIAELEQDPGRLVGLTVDIPPSGNEILSMLDVVTEDSVDPADLEAAVRRLHPDVAGEQQIDDLLIRFRVLRAQGPPADELAALAERAVALLREGPRKREPQPPGSQPLVFEVEWHEGAFELTLTESSAARVRAAGGAAHKMQISFDVAHDLQMLHGPFLMHLAQAATTLNGQRLRSLGGVQFRQKGDGQTLYEWPAPVS